MQIYLMRHGAAGAAQPGMPDSSRGLTAEGKIQVQQIGRIAGRALGTPLVIASPYDRAQQTALIMAKSLGLTAPIITCSELTPESTPKNAWSEVRSQANGSSLLLVGHEPLFSALTAY